MPEASGRVWLVGAGPGDPGLITVRGLELLRTADVVVHDRLIAPALLSEAKPGALLIYVGKEPKSAVVSQREISAVLIEYARAGRIVVRLKGGDPYVFGRGGEEAIAVAEAGMPVEVVPGVTSAVAVPAAAGIPISHRDHASTVAIVAAHRADDGDLPWKSLAGIDTVVILMGAERISQVCRKLIRAGKPPTTPAAAIRWGTMAHQQTLVCTLHELPSRFADAGLGPPSVIVIGEVVRLAERILGPEPTLATASAGRGGS